MWRTWVTTGIKEIKAILPALFCLVLTIFLILSTCPTLLNAEKNNQNTRVYVDASSNNFPPINILDENGDLKGFGRELADTVMKAVGAEVDHMDSSQWIELSAIMGYTELSKIIMPHESKLSGYLDEIMKAGNRAKDLVQQIFTLEKAKELGVKGLLMKPVIWSEIAQIVRKVFDDSR